jgi:hypothetical protein
MALVGAIDTHSNDTSVATSDPTPQTMTVAPVSLDPVPRPDVSWDISNSRGVVLSADGIAHGLISAQSIPHRNKGPPFRFDGFSVA